MQNQFSRTEMLIGKEGSEKLRHAKIAIFGIGRGRLLCGRRTSQSWSRKFYISR